MNICVIAPDYPDERRSSFTFVKQLVDAFARQGHKCYVVAPYSVTRNKRICKEKSVEHIGLGSVTILRPNYISFSRLKLFGLYVSEVLHKWSVNRALRKLPNNIDCVYGHFWNSAIEGYSYAKKKNLPLFVASGESEISDEVVDAKFQEIYDYISGVICVSSKNREESIEKGLTQIHKCIVIPNAVNPNIFYKYDKKECRTELGIPSDVFVVISVGWFNERKGINRVSAAIDMIPEDKISSIFIGNGQEGPTCRNIIFKGTVKHDKIAKYLSAADAFVLPTLREGCCNAIVEAMACGLPIISSDLSFNHDVLNEDNSIMINPKDVSEIATAIHKLYTDIDARECLVTNALMEAKKYTIDNRAKLIIDFIHSKMDKN